MKAIYSTGFHSVSVTEHVKENKENPYSCPLLRVAFNNVDLLKLSVPLNFPPPAQLKPKCTLTKIMQHIHFTIKYTFHNFHYTVQFKSDKINQSYPYKAIETIN